MRTTFTVETVNFKRYKKLSYNILYCYISFIYLWCGGQQSLLS